MADTAKLDQATRIAPEAVALRTLVDRVHTHPEVESGISGTRWKTRHQAEATRDLRAKLTEGYAGHG